MIDAAEALQHAHDLHVLHRDMKPSNLMIDTSGQCWIIDFGLAAHVGFADQAHHSKLPLDGGLETITGHDVLGTPAYMAPEQWDGGKVDARTDVWGLGATFYELLTLHRPFPEMERSDLEPAIRRNPPIPPRRIVANVPKDLDAICLHALQKDPEHRYPTALAFADDLRRWLNREPPSVRRGVPRRIRLWSARNKGWAAAIVLALAAVGGFIAAAVIRQDAAAAHALAAEQGVSSVAYKLLKKLQSDHSSSKELSWRNDILREAGEAAKIRPDVRLRDDAASVLVGIDGRMRYEFNATQCTSVAIDTAGNRILGGGMRSRRSGIGARLSDLSTDQSHVLSELAAGPVAFRGEDGVPLQLTASPEKPLRVSLWNVAADSRLWESKLPLESDASFATNWNGDPLLALSADGRMAGAAVRLGDNKNASLGRQDGLFTAAVGT
jgi:hypothetical protein